MEVFGSIFYDKNNKKYVCSCCDYSTSRKNNFTKHVSTDNHQNRANGSNLEVFGSIFEPEVANGNNNNLSKNPKSNDVQSQHTENSKSQVATFKKVAKSSRKVAKSSNFSGHHDSYQCSCCNKDFKTHGGLWKHSQKCKPKTPTNDLLVDPSHLEAANQDKETIAMLIKQNQEFKEMLVTQSNNMMELCKNIGSTNNSNNSHNTNVTQTNSHNKTFNLQFFLNETCKDAMNITDFIKSIELSLVDLEKVGELGYAEGMSRALVKSLNELEVTKRPIHCSDLKREIIHIKDQDKWERDTANQDRLRNAIKQISNKNLMLLDDWRREHPGCTEYNNIKNDMYLKMQCEAIGPVDELSERRDFGKIIRTIAKNTIINKGTYTS